MKNWLHSHTIFQISFHIFLVIGSIQFDPQEILLAFGFSS